MKYVSFEMKSVPAKYCYLCTVLDCCLPLCRKQEARVVNPL